MMVPLQQKIKICYTVATASAIQSTVVPGNSEMSLQQKRALADELYADIEREARERRGNLTWLIQQANSNPDEEAIQAFLREPYALVQKSAHEWQLIVPRFVKFAVGWLERVTPSYNILYRPFPLRD